MTVAVTRVVPIVGESREARRALVQGVSMSVREQRCAEMFHDMGVTGCPERAAARMITESLTAKQRIQFIAAFLKGRLEWCRASGKTSELGELEARIANAERILAGMEGS